MEKNGGTAAVVSSVHPHSPKAWEQEGRRESEEARATTCLWKSTPERRGKHMRLRKIEMDWGKGKVSLDLRSGGGHSSSVVGLLGSTGSGRTMLMTAAMRLFRSSIRETVKFEDWRGVSATVEFDLGSTIATGVIRDGEVIQGLVYPEMTVSEGRLSGGILAYHSDRGCFPFNGANNDAERFIRPILHDLYKGEVRNSIIWVDDFAMGLDDSCARDFLSVLVKKSMERDNQLIVSADREVLLQGVGAENIRVLQAQDTNFIQRVIGSL